MPMWILLPFLLALSLMILSFILSHKWAWNQEKFSAYECGFSAFSSRRTTFSTRFFLVALIFLLFDLELIFLLPIPLFSQLNSNLAFSLFMIILIIIYGLYHEWLLGSLDWAI